MRLAAQEGSLRRQRKTAGVLEAWSTLVGERKEDKKQRRWANSKARNGVVEETLRNQEQAVWANEMSDRQQADDRERGAKECLGVQDVGLRGGGGHASLFEASSGLDNRRCSFFKLGSSRGSVGISRGLSAGQHLFNDGRVGTRSRQMSVRSSTYGIQQFGMPHCMKGVRVQLFRCCRVGCAGSRFRGQRKTHRIEKSSNKRVK